MASLLSLFTGNNGIGFGISNSNTNSAQNSNYSTQGSTTQTPNLSPYQSALIGPLSSALLNLTANPQATIQPFENQALDQVNSTYNGLADSLRQQFLGSTGGGGSGKFGMALAQGNLNRIGQLAGTQTQFQQLASTLPLQTAGLAEGLLGLNLGGYSVNSSGSGSQSAQGTSSTSGSSLHI
jgi:hypothetical protein